MGDPLTQGRDRLVCVMDIPTPYRTHFFNQLHQQLALRGTGFEVVFLAAQAPERFWRFDPRDVRFRYTIAPGWRPVVRGSAYPFNPMAILRLLRHPPRWLLLGGGWNQPSPMLLSLLMPLVRPTTHIVFWVEANAAGMAYQRGPVAAIRRRVLGRGHGYGVPGRVAERTLREVIGLTGGSVLPLPNLVDETHFRDRVRASRHQRDEMRAAYGIAPDDMLLLWPARYEEQTKGIMNFLGAVQSALRSANRRVVIVVAGEGRDRKEIEEFLDAHGMRDVKLVGFIAQDELVRLQASADAMLLPSIRDANPLSVIEGLWAGLPILMSNRCGNWPEVVRPGTNGWVVDPAEPASLLAATTELVRASPERLREMGRASLRVAEENFSSDVAVRKFIDALEELDRPRAASTGSVSID